MPQVSFTQNLQRHVACPTARVPGETVSAALEAVFRENARLRGYVLDDQGAVRPHIAIFVSGRPIRDRRHLSDPVPADGEVFVMQALSGG